LIELFSSFNKEAKKHDIDSCYNHIFGFPWWWEKLKPRLPPKLPHPVGTLSHLVQLQVSWQKLLNPKLVSDRRVIKGGTSASPTHLIHLESSKLLVRTFFFLAIPRLMAKANLAFSMWL
jgi:hypothetical protein